MPTIPEAWALALQHHRAGRLPEAELVYRQIVAADPDHHDAWHMLGVIACQCGKYRAGVDCIERVLRHRPNWAQAHYNLGNAWRDLGKLDEAVACYQRAVQWKPDYLEAHHHLGKVFKKQEKLDEAAACYRRALELKPDYVEAHIDLGNVFRDVGKLNEAAAGYYRALQLKPDHVRALSNLGTVLKDAGWLDEAAVCYRSALERKPDFAEAHSSLLLTYQYGAAVTLSELAAAHAEYDRQHAEPLRTARAPHVNDRDPLRRLRLGFVSPDFGRHRVGYFLIRALENLDRNQCETVCYCDRIIKDDLARRFQAAATVWRDVVGLSDEGLTEKILSDRIDILFDLAGHTAHNRLLVFARKPAPVQITWIGYKGTTGLDAIDYILADRYTIPAGQEAWYRERVLRMPDGYVCYDPPEPSPDVAPSAAAKNGYIRYGSFNSLAKITPQVVEVWAKVLGRVPDSRLRLKYKGLGDESVCGRYLDLFAMHGVDPSRVELTPPSAGAEYVTAYGEIDIALDPFPFGGGITTCDAIWSGVPVITCPGETFASRHSLSHLLNVGLTETIAATMDEYVELAVSLAGDLPRLSRLRAGLRQRMIASPLCDGKRFAANLMQVLRGAWRQWCQDEPAADSRTVRGE
jgi:predicted O-linked N-acetylglucosamine transferase (SPINDLY family)